MLFLDDGRLSLQYNITAGAYNIRDPRHNSPQDYIGDFYDPTVPVEADCETEDVTYDPMLHVGSTVAYPITYTEQDPEYLDLVATVDPTIPDKHYNFIAENFAFLA